MIKKEFKVPIYGFHIVIIEIEPKDDAEKIKPIFKRFHFVQEDEAEIIENIQMKRFNGGHLYTSASTKTFIAFIYPSSSISKRRNTIDHEKRHIEDRILKICQVNDIEAAGYLAGFLSEKMY